MCNSRTGTGSEILDFGLLQVWGFGLGSASGFAKFSSSFGLFRALGLVKCGASFEPGPRPAPDLGNSVKSE